jgi:hypothetical protein
MNLPGENPMKPLLRRCLIRAVYGLAAALLLGGLLRPAPAQAGGAQPILPGGSSIQPGEETPVQMTSVVVTFNIRQATEADNMLVSLTPNYYGFQRQPVWFPAAAEAKAVFTLKNPTSQTISMTVWYPMANVLEVVDWKLSTKERIARIQEFEVDIDGVPSNAMVSDLPNPKGADKPDLPWVNFPVTFAAGKETTIEIRTKFPLQPSVSGIEMTLYNVFHTAAGWAGPIGQTELILNLPYPASTETLAGIPAGSLRVPPYYRPSERADLSSEAVLEGNQARWRWKDMEPGPEDDFTLWLLQPGKWQELESTREAVQTNLKDGQAWLNLGSNYYSLSSNGSGWPTVFRSNYIPQGIEAFQKAADLLPERAAPHAGVGLLTLELYTVNRDAPPEVLQTVQDELQTARELEAKNPFMAKETGRTRWLLSALETELEEYFPEEPNTTPEGDAASRVSTATKPAETASLTPSRVATFEATAIPTASPAPVNNKTTGMGTGTRLLLAAGVIGLGAAGYLIANRARKKKGAP